MSSINTTEILSDWNDLNIEYVLMRGWNGKDIVGSDIDILVSPACFGKLKQSLLQRDFTQSKRGLLFIDFLANERYFDQHQNGTKIRFHVTDTLIFGKLTRKVRFPYENVILSQAKFSEEKNAKVPQPHQLIIINIIRALIDKPQRHPGKIHVETEALINSVPFDCQTTLRQLVTVYNAVCDGQMKPRQAQADALGILREVENSQYWSRLIQRSYADILIVGYCKIFKPFL